MPESASARERRLRRWRHLGLAGSVRLTLQVIRNIQECSSTTAETVKLAKEIEPQLQALLRSLATRVDC